MSSATASAAAPRTPVSVAPADLLARHFQRVRARTLALAAPLAPEDCVAQSMPDASPTKWHLAHTTWFFEAFVLGRDGGYAPPHPDWHYLFNSYYQTVGPMHARPQRGLLTRPTLDEVRAWRHEVDGRVLDLLAGGVDDDMRVRIRLGLEHEQQHQELLLTDIKHLFSVHPLRPAYDASLAQAPAAAARPLRFRAGLQGVHEIGRGAAADAGDFAFDCETPRHRVLLQPHALAERPTSNAEFLEFIRDGGYRTPTLWMAEGWDLACREGWQRPIYWMDDDASEFTLGGVRALDPHAPVCHVSFFEADAFARWAGLRLPTEAEWETRAARLPSADGNFADAGLLHPRGPQDDDAGATQLFGDVWEWTSSPYVAYPGFRPLPGALGEYNGKFMCGQWILRGGSCATPAGHVRGTYRNFFHPAARWQFSGIRLARDEAPGGHAAMQEGR
ncbi:ergothioneine biosynthesis protein EgtB [Coralloluteibacterium stylophorae]|uniref:Ergothioneine biosynthesis protein EgtB n=1 Tax=Coralloluteibacterium stylophorae TaxID=1776034 RepID=A0A8J7VTS2_9GAMM|nr:ergothioneine biosynthesis protein EgtB [Coralloluteibacterium stylophorae]MBS7457404.1 ergothioneine biosynthesis protein EgtB [Coralloluteibacterium stylophorae]